MKSFEKGGGGRPCVLHVRDSFGTPALPQFSPAVLLFVKHFEALFCVIDLGCVAATTVRGGSLGGGSSAHINDTPLGKGAPPTAGAKATQPQASAAGDAWSSSHELASTSASSSSSSLSSSFRKTAATATATPSTHPSTTTFSSGGGSNYVQSAPPSSSSLLFSHRLVNPLGRK